MKTKVFNNNSFNVGIRFENEANREILIRGKSFALMVEDDILYVDTASKLFEEGILFIEDQELNEKMGYSDKNPNTISDEEIAKILASNIGIMKKSLEKINAQHAKDKVVQIAKETDLPKSKIEAIETLYGVKIFEDLGDTIV